MEPPSRSPLPRFLPTYLEALMVIGFLAFLNPITSFDLWWHLACGREFLALGAVPGTEFLTTGSDGGGWTAFYWLWCVLAWSVVRVGGLPALLVVKAACAAIATRLFALIARESGIRRTGPFLVTVLLGMSVLFSQLWNLRAQMTSVVGVPLIFWLFLRSQRRGRPAWVSIPLVTWFWANCHAGFVLALVVWGVFFVGALMRAAAGKTDRKPVRDLAGLGALMILACCLTPRGPAFLLYPFWYLGNVQLQTRITEWSAVVIRDYPLLEGALILMAVLAVAVPVSTRVEPVLLLGAALHFIFQAARHMYLYGTFVAPLVGLRLQVLLESMRSESPADPPEAPGPTVATSGLLSLPDPAVEPVKDRSAVAWLLIALIVAGLTVAGWWRDENHVLVTSVYPREQFAYLESHPPDGPLFNEFYLGGLVLYHLYPHCKPFVDGRVDIHIDSGAFTEYLTCIDQLPGWEEVFANRGFTWAFVERGAVLDHALRTRGWTEFGPQSEGFSLIRRPEPAGS